MIHVNKFGKLLLHVEIEKVVVLLRDGTDIISIHPRDVPTAFPEMKYPLTISIEARHGYGEQWVRENLHVEPEVIKT